MRKSLVAVGILVAFAASSADAGTHKWGLKEGTPDIKSAGQLAFGPDGILFIGDTKGGAVFAIDTGDAKAGAPKSRAIEKLADALGKVKGLNGPVAVNDLAINPLSGNIYLSVSSGADKAPGIVKVDGEGKLSAISLINIAFLKATLANVPEDKVTGEGPRARNRRNEAITDLAYSEGKLIVSGLTTAEAPSSVREIAFPFADRDTGISIEIFHGAHGKVEDYAAIRTFVPMMIDGKPSLLAGFTCTPLVRFSLDGVEAGAKARGTTVAELGNRNSPLDLIVYEKDGEKFLLMSNTARGVMKISTKDIGRKEGITAPVRNESGKAGQTYETIAELEGTVQLDKLNDEQAVVIVQKDGAQTLRTIALP